MTLSDAIGREDSHAMMVAAGGCNIPFPNVPWQPPQESPYIPPYLPRIPPIPDYGTTTTTKLIPKSEPKMEQPFMMTVYIIWAVDGVDSDVAWAVAVVDQATMDENEEAWLAEVAKAEEAWGARNIRVTKTKINYDAVLASFAPAEI